MTGGSDGGQFVTDVTNASRTMLMNIYDLKWDEQLCRYLLVIVDNVINLNASTTVTMIKCLALYVQQRVLSGENLGWFNDDAV